MINISSKEQCCGCSACVQRCPKSCIYLHEDDEGFLYPQVDKANCVNCNLCEKVCPILCQGEQRIPLSVYAAKNKNERIRVQSSSGGIFTLLAEKIIQESGVVFGAGFDDNWEVVHSCTKTLTGLSVFRGSKYVQSKIGNTYKQVEDVLLSGRVVLFSGTPCQIKGLKLFLHKEYDNLLTVDFICHGVPSPKVWRMYLQELVFSESFIPSFKRPKISDINFRDKITGWKNFSFSVGYSYLSVDGKRKFDLISQPFSNNTYMKAFLSDLILRPSCYKCFSKQGRSNSDITIADYWGIQNIMPEMDDDKGTSLVFLNSIKGENSFPFSLMEYKKAEYEEAVQYNRGIKEDTLIPSKRAIFFKLIEKGISLESVVASSLHISFSERIYRKINREISRIWYSFKCR